MRTTVKLDTSRSLVIEPAEGGVRMAIKLGGVVVGSFTLSPDQLGATIFGAEQAAAAAGVSPARASLS